ncbi:cyclin-D-binding Myb-like transcription factor 1 isoform X2 [Lytechinus variegatus]|nr:cyclin-D-binding Myb-like transcription factor 1 isoform X2 [Lytechinus variegatus]
MALLQTLQEVSDKDCDHTGSIHVYSNTHDTQTLELHVDRDQVVSAVGLMPSTSGNQMEIGVQESDVRHVGLPVHSEADDGSNIDQSCIVVVPVESVEDSHGHCLDKGFQLSAPTDVPVSGSSNAMAMTGVEQRKEPETPYDPVTQSWFTTKYSKDSLSERGHKWKQGMWSNDEIELLERNIEEYVRDHNLKDATEVIFNNSKDNRKNFYRSIAQGLQRPLFAVYRRVIRMYDQKNHVGRYTPEDIVKLKELRAKYGNDWASIGAEMGRSASSVKDKFRLLKDSCNRGKWTASEEKLLSSAVFALSGAEPGESVTTGISWSQVADKVGTRTEKQCRAKWLNYLNWKQKGGSKWTLMDELTLINRVDETGVEVDTDIDWENIAKNWESVRSPQWLRSKWWNLKRQVIDTDFKTLIQHLRLFNDRRRFQEEKRKGVIPPLKPEKNQTKNGTLIVQVPIQLGSSSGDGMDDGSGLQPLILRQSALAHIPGTSSLFMSEGMTTVHSDNHIIIQVTGVQGHEGEVVGTDGNKRQIIITARQPQQTVPSLGQDMSTDMHQTSTELSSGDASAIVNSGDDLHSSNDHMTTSIGQSQVTVGEEHQISNEAQLIGTDAVLPQQDTARGTDVRLEEVIPFPTNHEAKCCECMGGTEQKEVITGITRSQLTLTSQRWTISICFESLHADSSSEFISPCPGDYLSNVVM